MHRLTLALAALAVALALPAAALAKGPSAAKIEGPGLKSPLTFDSRGSGTALGNLTQLTGFFPAVFGQSPSPMLTSPPKGELGPRYKITYTVPGPNNTSSTIRQDLYPYAKPFAATYMKPNQPFWEGDRTRGGWFRSGASLKDTLVDAGLPALVPRGGDDSGFSATWIIVTAVGGIVLAGAGGLAALSRRRRPAVAS